MQPTSDKYAPTRKSHSVAKELQLHSNAFPPGRQSKLRGRGCAKRLGLTLSVPCLFTMPRSRHVFPKAPCISVLRLRNHTLPFLLLALLSFLHLPYSICLLALCHVIFQCSSEISFGRQKNFYQTFRPPCFALRVSVKRDSRLRNEHYGINEQFP